MTESFAELFEQSEKLSKLKIISSGLLFFVVDALLLALMD